MGDREEPPSLLLPEAALITEDGMNIEIIQREVKYLQVIERDLDSTHFSTLHFGGTEADEMHPDSGKRIAHEN